MIHYKNGECFSSVGIMNEIIKINDSYDIEHTADTGFGSSGSPLILFNYKVVGVQRGFIQLKNYNFNKGTLLKFPINEFNKRYKINNFIKVNGNNKIKYEEIDDKKEKKNVNLDENEKNEIIIKAKIEEKDIGKKINFINFNVALNEYKEIINNIYSFDLEKKKYQNSIKVIEKQLLLLNQKNVILFINNTNIEFNSYFIPKTSGIYTIKLIFKIKLECCESMFFRCNNLIDINLSNFNIQNVTHMSTMFADCNDLININLSNLNAQNVTDMSAMFACCNNLTNINLSNFNTQNVKNMSAMFMCCKNLTNINLSNFNTQNVTGMSGMFYGCNNLTKINLSNFNTHNLVKMTAMFYGCSNLNYINLSNFNTQNVDDMSVMFYNCKNLTNINLSNFNTQNVIYMSSIFYGCNKLTNIIINDKLSKEMIMREAPSSVYKNNDCLLF